MQDSQVDQPMADGTFPVENENLSIYLHVSHIKIEKAQKQSTKLNETLPPNKV